MLLDFNNPDPAPPIEKTRDRENEKTGLPSDNWTMRPAIQSQMIRWIVSLGLSSTAATMLTEQFCEEVKKKAAKEGTRREMITYEVGFENSYIKIHVPRSQPRDPEELLEKYLFLHEVKGDWQVVSTRTRVGKWVYLCKKTTKTRSKQGKQKAAMNAIDKLSPRQAEMMLEALLKMVEK